MTDPQQPATTPDQGSVPPPPPAPDAANPWDLPAAPQAPAQPAPPAAPQPAAPQVAAEPAEPAPFTPPANPYVTQPGNPYAPQGGNPYVTPTANPYAAQPIAPAGAPVPPGQAGPAAPQPAAPNPYAAQPAAPQPAAPNPYAAQPAAPDPYAAQPAAPNPYAQPAYAQPGYTQPGYPQPGYAQPQPSRLNVPGLVAIILGAIGLLIGLIPFVGFFGSLLALVGVILGIVGAVSKTKPRLLGIIGAAVSGLALLLSILISTWAIISFSQTFGEGGSAWESDYTEEDYGYEEVAPEVSGAGAGTMDDPAAVGDAITYFDYAGDPEWEAVVGAPTLDATADVLAAEAYNPQPEAGNQYVLVPLTLTAVGDYEAYPSDFDPWFVGPDGDGYELSYVSYPDDLYSFDTIAPGETIVVNLVFEVPSTEVTGSALELTTWASDAAVYVALG